MDSPADAKTSPPATHEPQIVVYTLAADESVNVNVSEMFGSDGDKDIYGNKMRFGVAKEDDRFVIQVYVDTYDPKTIGHVAVLVRNKTVMLVPETVSQKQLRDYVNTEPLFSAFRAHVNKEGNLKEQRRD